MGKSIENEGTDQPSWMISTPSSVRGEDPALVYRVFTLRPSGTTAELHFNFELSEKTVVVSNSRSSRDHALEGDDWPSAGATSRAIATIQ